MWFLRRYPRGKVVITSGSFNQIKNQLMKNRLILSTLLLLMGLVYLKFNYLNKTEIN